MTDPRRPFYQPALDDWAGAAPETDADMDDALRALSASVDLPQVPDLAGAVGARLRAELAAPGPGAASRHVPTRGPMDAGLRSRFRLRRSVVLAFAALLILAGVAAALAYGLGGLRIVFVQTVPTPPPTPIATIAPTGSGGPAGSTAPVALGADLQLGRPVTLEEAAGSLGFAPLAPPKLAILGQPDAVYVDDIPTGGMASYVYAPRNGIPETAPGSGVGLVITEFRAELRDELFQKLVGSGTTMDRTTVHGGRAYYLSGELHAFLYQRGGDVKDERFRLVGNALLWQRDGLILRLEGDLSLEAAVTIAASMD